MHIFELIVFMFSVTALACIVCGDLRHAYARRNEGAALARVLKLPSAEVRLWVEKEPGGDQAVTIFAQVPGARRAAVAGIRSFEEVREAYTRLSNSGFVVADAPTWLKDPEAELPDEEDDFDELTAFTETVGSILVISLLMTTAWNAAKAIGA